MDDIDGICHFSHLSVIIVVFPIHVKRFTFEDQSRFIFKVTYVAAMKIAYINTFLENYIS